MAQSSLGYVDDEQDPAAALPESTEERASTSLRSPAFQLAADPPEPPPVAQPEQFGTPMAGALGDFQAAPQAEEPPAAPRMLGAGSPEIDDAMQALGQGPEPVGPVRDGYQELAAQEMQRRQRASDQQKTGLHAYLRSKGVETEVQPDGSHAIALNEDGSPRWKPARSQPFTDPETGRPVVRERDARGNLADVDLFSTKGIVHTDPATGARFYMGPGNQPVDLNSPDPEVARMAQVKQLRSDLYANEQLASHQVEQIKASMVPAQQTVAQMGAMPAGGGEFGSKAKPVKSLENVVTALTPLAAAGKLDDEQTQQLKDAQTALERHYQDFPEHQLAKDAIAGGNAQIAAINEARLQDRDRRLKLLMDPNTSSAVAAALPKPTGNAGPGEVETATVDQDTAQAAAQGRTTQSLALPGVLMRMKASGVQFLKNPAGEMRPIDDAIAEARNPPPRPERAAPEPAPRPAVGFWKNMVGQFMNAADQSGAQFGEGVLRAVGATKMADEAGNDARYAKEVASGQFSADNPYRPGGPKEGQDLKGWVDPARRNDFASGVASGASDLPVLLSNPWMGGAAILAKGASEGGDEAVAAGESRSGGALKGAGKGAATLAAFALLGGPASKALTPAITKPLARGLAAAGISTGVNSIISATMSSVFGGNALPQTPAEWGQRLMFDAGFGVHGGVEAAKVPGHITSALQSKLSLPEQIQLSQARLEILNAATDALQAGDAGGAHVAATADNAAANLKYLNEQKAATQKFLDAQNPRLVAKLDARLKQAMDAATAPDDSPAAGAPDQSSPSGTSQPAEESAASSSEPAPTGPTAQAKAFSATLRAKDAIGPRLAEDQANGKPSAATNDELNAHDASLHAAAKDATEQVPAPIRQRLAAIVGGDAAENEAHFAETPEAAFAAAHVGKALRDTYTTPEQQAALGQMAGRAGEHEPVARFVADQHVGMLAGKDLLAIATGRGEVPPERVAALGRLGLVEPGEDGAPAVTHDALPLMPKGLTARLLRAHDQYRVKSLEGDQLAGVDAMVRNGQGQLEDALYGRADKARVAASPKPHLVRVHFTDGRGNAREKVLGVSATSEEQALANATAKIQKGATNVTHAEITTAEKEQARRKAPVAPVDNGNTAAPAKLSDFSPAEQQFAALVHNEYKRNRQYLAALGITNVELVKNSSDRSGLAVTKDGSLQLDAGQLKAQADEFSRRGVKARDWARNALQEEATHAMQFKAAEKAGVDWREHYADIRNDPSLPPELLAKARETYDGFDALAPHEQGAEIERMVLQQKWTGTITERIFKSIESVIDYLRGLKIESPLLKESIARVEAVREEALKRAADEAREPQSPAPARPAAEAESEPKAGTKDDPFNLAGEHGVDWQRRADERSKAERDAEEARAKQERDQMALFSSRAKRLADQKEWRNLNPDGRAAALLREWDSATAARAPRAAPETEAADVPREPGGSTYHPALDRFPVRTPDSSALGGTGARVRRPVEDVKDGTPIIYDGKLKTVATVHERLPAEGTHRVEFDDGTSVNVRRGQPLEVVSPKEVAALKEKQTAREEYFAHAKKLDDINAKMSDLAKSMHSNWASAAEKESATKEYHALMDQRDRLREETPGEALSAAKATPKQKEEARLAKLRETRAGFAAERSGGAPVVKESLTTPEPHVLTKPEGRSVVNAYHHLARVTGFPAIGIADLADQSGVPLDRLKQQLLRSQKAGSVVLSTGDWSLSSAKDKAGVIESNGQKMLQVRFLKEESLAASKAQTKDQSELGFYSHLSRVAEAKLPNRAAPEQIMATLKGAGVKQSEMDWMGLPQFLEGKANVTKDELRQFIAENRVQMKEVVKGTSADDKAARLRAAIEDGIKATDEDDLDPEEYPEWRGAAETLLDQGEKALAALDRGDYETAADLARSNSGMENEYGDNPAWGEAGRIADDEDPHHFDKHGIDQPKFTQYTLPGGTNHKELNYTLPKLKGGEYTVPEAHKYGDESDKNRIFHVRQADHVDTEGAKVRLIEEIQSDLHQEAREVYASRFPSFEQWAQDNQGATRGDYESAKKAEGMVPDAPFKKTWPEVGFKRALRMAVEDGMDKIAWTTGEQQADRYSLEKKVDSLYYDPDTTRLYASKDGKTIIDGERVPVSELRSAVGKEVADKLLAAPKNSRGNHQLEGEELKVGGSGMRGFYDKILPDFVRKYVKPWNGKVETAELPKISKQEAEMTYGSDPLPKSEKSIVHSVTITPAMRESVQNEGQALFASKANADPVAARKEGYRGKEDMQAKVDEVRAKEKEKTRARLQAARDKASERAVAAREKMSGMVDKATAYKEVLRKAQAAGKAGVKRGVGETRESLVTRDRELAADMENLKNEFTGWTERKPDGKPGPYHPGIIQDLLPPEERGHFISQVANLLTERPSLLRGDADRPFRSAMKLMGKIQDKADEVYRKELAAEILETAKKADNSPSVDVNYKVKLKALTGRYSFVQMSVAKRAELESRWQFVKRQQLAGNPVGISKAEMNELKRLTVPHVSELPTAALEALRDKVQDLTDQGRLTVDLRERAQERLKAEDMQIMQSAHAIPYEDKELIADLPPTAQGEKQSLPLSSRLVNAWRGAMNQAAKTGRALLPIDAAMDIMEGGKGTYSGGFLFRRVRGPIDLGYNATFRAMHDVEERLNTVIKKHNLTAQDSRRIGTYAAAVQEGGRARLLKVMPEAHLDALLKSMTPGELEAYREMRDTMQSAYGPLREQMRQLYNQDVAPVANYFPMIRDWSEYAKTQDAPRPVDPVSGATAGMDELATWRNVVEDVRPTNRTSVEKGFTIERQDGAMTPIKIDAFDVYRRHMRDVLHLLNTQTDLKRIGEVVRSPEFASKYGRAGRQVVVDWLDTVARNGGVDASKRIAMLDWLRTRSSVGMVAFRAVSMLKHISNAGLAIHHVGPGWYTKGLTNVLRPEVQEFMRRNMAETFAREGGEQAIEEATKLSRAAALGFLPVRVIDRMNAQASALGYYLKDMQAKGFSMDDALKVDTQTAKSQMTPAEKAAVTSVQDALVRMRRIVASPNPKDSPQVISRGTGLGGNVSWARSVFQFGNIFLDRWSNVRHDLYGAGIKQRNVSQSTTMAVGLLAAIAAEAGITLGMRQFWNSATDNHPKEEKGYGHELLDHALKQFPFMGQAMSMWDRGDSGIPILDAPKNLVTEGHRAMNAKDGRSAASHTVRAVGGAASLLGLPGAGQVSDVAAKALGAKDENSVQRLMREGEIKRKPEAAADAPQRKDIVASVRQGANPREAFKSAVAGGMKPEQARGAVKEGMKPADVAAFEKLPLPAAIEVYKKGLADPKVPDETKKQWRAILQRKHANARQLKPAA